MLKHRLLMSALLIPAMIGLFVWDAQFSHEQAPILFVVVLAISARCVWELVTLSRAAGFRPSLALCWVWTWFVLFAGWSPHLYGGSQMSFLFQWREYAGFNWLVGATLSILFVSIFRFRTTSPTDLETNRPLPPGHHLASAGIEFFIIQYVGVLLMITTRLRWTLDGGYFALGALVIATKMGDVGAYTFGRLIGGPKMTPRLSPGKTWAGGVGHIVTAGLSSAAWLCWIGPQINGHWHAWQVWPAIVFGVVVGFAGLMGDLAESLIKRDVGVKDAPALLPGFGGLLDLMDSLLLAGPVAYGMWHLLR
ncbi:MAG: phosphatidate cytidylyltransferase [Planctomycetaceae bacterium]|nr:phosphatidate cytidylyltransferase [Planctomycetaceae bacterium]